MLRFDDRLVVDRDQRARNARRREFNGIPYVGGGLRVTRTRPKGNTLVSIRLHRADPVEMSSNSVDGILTFLDMMFRCATLIVEPDHTFSRSAQIGDDEPNTGIKFAGVPLWRLRSASYPGFQPDS